MNWAMWGIGVSACLNGMMASNFDGEVKAILLAPGRLGQEPTSKAGLFVDSQAAILA
jgi:hypothetical protein